MLRYLNVEALCQISSFNTLHINQLKIYLPNTGIIENTDNIFADAVFWPGGVNAYQQLFWNIKFMWAGYTGNELRVNGLSGVLQPGKIMDNGLSDDPRKERYRVYRILRNWESTPYGPDRDQLEKDYNEWPVEDGAPWVDKDGDGIFTRGVDQPDFTGDEVLFYVANDLDSSRAYGYASKPMGLEFQVTLYAFNRSGILGDAAFEKIKIINKGRENIEDMYFGISGDADLGENTDNYTGYDTTSRLGYCFNKDNYDEIYGESPPAAGLLELHGIVIPGTASDSALINDHWKKGYKNESLSSFLALYANAAGDLRYPQLPSYQIYSVPFDSQFYNCIRGKLLDGNFIINPVTMQPTKYMVTGDPVSGDGWYMGEGGWPDNDTLPPPLYSANRFSLNYGPFTLAPFDTQEVVFGILAARGTDNLNSVTELKRRAAIIRKAYYLNFQLTPPPPSPQTFGFEQQGEITLWWKPAAESYDQGDPFIYDQGYEDTTYTFEGYRVWQYRDTLGTDPRLLAVFDRTDGITVIEDYTIANGVSVKLPIIIGNDEGLRRQTTISTDAYTHQRLNNGSPYYFGVTAYGYSKNSSPAFLESKPDIAEVIPGRDKIDYSSPYRRGDEVFAEQTSGMSNADVIFRVVDPTRITGNSYRVDFSGPYDSLKYMLINTSLGDTLFRGENDYSADTLHRRVFDGFMVIVNNKGHKQIDSIPASFQPYGITRILETRGPGGIPLDNPVDVYNSTDPSGRWKITSSGGIIQNIDVFSKIYTDDYEIRFTSEGSEYYPFGYPTSNNLFGANLKAADRVPFEIWNVSKGKRINIKIQDLLIKDNKWSKDTAANQWEKIYGYRTGTDYNEPIPSPSETSDQENFPFGNLTIEGELPEEGTVIRIETFKPLVDEDQYTASPQKADFNNTESAKDKIDKISVFPNPYFGGNDLERSLGERIIRFTGLPKEVTIRIYTLAGVFVRRIDKSDLSQYIDWDLKNENGSLVASGVYIAHLEMPGIGTKILKIAVVVGKEFLNRE